MYKESMKLIIPSKEYFSQIQALKEDFIANNETRIQGSGSVEKYDDLEKWLNSILEIEKGLNELIVPTLFYLIVVNDEVVGTICLRKKLTEELKAFGGHIGYSIKPSARGNGYAKEALRLLLSKHHNEYDEILIMCEENNIASNKTIIANNGVLIDKIYKFGMTINRYKIKSEKYKQ